MRDGCDDRDPRSSWQGKEGATTRQARKLVQCTFLSELDKCHVSRVTRTHSKGEKEDGRRIDSSHSRPGIRKANRAPQTCERRYFLPRSSCMKVLCTRGQTQEPEGSSHPGAGCIATAAERSKHRVCNGSHILSIACIRHHPLVCLSISLASTSMSHLTHLS